MPRGITCHVAVTAPASWILRSCLSLLRSMVHSEAQESRSCPRTNDHLASLTLWLCELQLPRKRPRLDRTPLSSDIYFVVSEHNENDSPRSKIKTTRNDCLISETTSTKVAYWRTPSEQSTRNHKACNEAFFSHSRSHSHSSLALRSKIRTSWSACE